MNTVTINKLLFAGLVCFAASSVHAMKKSEEQVMQLNFREESYQESFFEMVKQIVKKEVFEEKFGFKDNSEKTTINFNLNKEILGLMLNHDDMPEQNIQERESLFATPCENEDMQIDVGMLSNRYWENLKKS